MELTYAQFGDYLIPDLVLADTREYHIGKYGRMRRAYLKDHRPAFHSTLLLIVQKAQKEQPILPEKKMIRDRSGDTIPVPSICLGCGVVRKAAKHIKISCLTEIAALEKLAGRSVRC